MATLPTLTLSGFTEDRGVMIYKLFGYFLTSDYSQTVIYYGKIHSLKYILMQSSNDFTELKSNINASLTELYKRYYDTVDVTTEIKEEDENKKKKYSITIEIEATYNGNVYKLTQTAHIANNIISNLDELLSKLLLL